MKLKQIALSLVALVLVACQDATEPAGVSDLAGPSLRMQTPPQGTPERVVAGIVVVKLHNDASADEIAAAHGLSVARRGPRNAFVLLRGAAGNERALAARRRGWERAGAGRPSRRRSSGRLRGAGLPTPTHRRRSPAVGVLQSRRNNGRLHARSEQGVTRHFVSVGGGR
jgi:hypothetical protein